MLRKKERVKKKGRWDKIQLTLILFVWVSARICMFSRKRRIKEGWHSFKISHAAATAAPFFTILVLLQSSDSHATLSMTCRALSAKSTPFNNPQCKIVEEISE
jgi:hypothetical protein